MCHAICHVPAPFSALHSVRRTMLFHEFFCISARTHTQTQTQCVRILEDDPNWSGGAAQHLSERVFRKLGEHGSGEFALQQRKRMFMVQASGLYKSKGGE